MTRRLSNRRIRLLALAFVVVFAGTLARAVWLQGVRAQSLDTLAQVQHREVVTLPARRGSILDRTGMPLALEQWPAKFRGIASGILQGGYSAGFLLSSLVYQLGYPLISDRPASAWRIMLWAACRKARSGSRASALSRRAARCGACRLPGCSTPTCSG